MEPTVAGGKKGGSDMGGKKPQKDEKSTEKDASARNAMTVSEVKRLEEEVQESKTKLNNMLLLIDAARDGDKDEQSWKVQMAALLALCRCCSRLMETGDLVPPGCTKGKEVVKGLNRAEVKESKGKLAVWLVGTYKEVTKVALDMVQGEHVKGQLVGMRAAMGLVAREAETAAELGCSAQVWTDGLFSALVSAMLSSTHTSRQVLKSFHERYLDLYGDVRYYAWRAVSSFAAKALVKEEQGGAQDGSVAARNAYDLMCLLKIPDAEERKVGKGEDRKKIEIVSMSHLVASLCSSKGAVHDEDEGEHDDEAAPANKSASSSTAPSAEKKRKQGGRVDLTSKGVYCKAFSDAWVALMRLELPPDVLKSILTNLHTDILPHMTQPLLLSDILTACYERGGILAVLSLHALFSLIQEDNLEYASFYPKLYAQLDTDIFHVRHRSRVFKLMELCLKTPLLPAGVVAAFIKRLARLSLSCPTAGCLVALTLIYNLLRRHPACLTLIHRIPPPSQSKEERAFAGDLYDMDEPDPAKARALESSLWELLALRRHAVACPPPPSLSLSLFHPTMHTTEGGRVCVKVCSIKCKAIMSMWVWEETGSGVDWRMWAQVPEVSKMAMILP
jgi:U3 small nucleolar RNA-associated protein 19